MNNNSKKRPKVDPKKLRKASRTRADYAQSIEVVGKREATDHGYKIPGTVCKEYETFFEHISERQSTDKLRHDKKTRTYRVVGGRGFALLEKDGEQKSVVMLPGVELTIEPGITYTLATTSEHPLDVFVSQSSKYALKLEVMEASETKALLDPDLLKSRTTQQLVEETVASDMPTRRGSSKAAQQQRRMRQKRGQTAPTPAVPAGAAQNDRAFSPNLRPTYGGDLRGEPG